MNRKTKKYKDFCLKVKERDGYKCTECGSVNNLHVHHIVKFNSYGGRWDYDVENGLTLCKSCHSKIHGKLKSNEKLIEVGFNTRFVKGHIPHNHYTGFSDEAKQKMSESHKGKHYSVETEFKKGVNHPLYGKKGSDHPRFGKAPWNKGISKIEEARK